MEFTRVAVEGRPDYDGEVALGVRTAPQDADPACTQGATHGRYMLTPVRLSDGSSVFVNRGWVPEDEDSKTWPENAIDASGTVRFVGVARLGEAMPKFVTEGQGSREDMRNWHWLDLQLLQRMQEGALPLVVDAHEPEPANGKWPIRRMAKHYLEFNIMPMMHHIYAATWFSLSLGIVAVGVALLRRGRVPVSSGRIRGPASPSDIYRRSTNVPRGGRRDSPRM